MSPHWQTWEQYPQLVNTFMTTLVSALENVALRKLYFA